VAPIDYEEFCGANSELNGDIPTISVHDLKRRIEANGTVTIVDVRESFEYEIARIEGSTLIPLGELPARLGELHREEEIILLCKSGCRSAQAVQMLQRAGFAQLYNLAGGIDAWANEIDPGMQRY
jgi:adenylyltransferase/sulfurtransferase